MENKVYFIKLTAKVSKIDLLEFKTTNCW